MKKSLFVLTFSLVTLFAKADEGMWLPILLEQLNIEDMQARGFKLTAEDIYSINKSSMKDGVVLFGGGCTGEVISNEGLILTNHHCGSSTINGLSSLDNNYLRDGFWATNKNGELPAPGLSVTFIISMHDVTDSIIPYLDNNMSEATRAAIIKQLSFKLEKQFTKNTHYDAQVKPFYYGNAFYLFITEKFTDIRLVGAPPFSVGDFGGETDNWIWPRHTGDFSLFRIYANIDNNPADFSEDNVPFKPRFSFPISIKGVKEGDFTMVYGFPGRTQEYLPAAAVDLTVNSTNPNRIACRDKRTSIMNSYMVGNDTVTLMYASKIRSISNAYKKWSGEMIGLKANDAVAKKEAFENKFQQWANTHEGKDYRYLLSNIDTVYRQYKDYAELVDYTTEAFFAVELMNFVSNYNTIAGLLQTDTVSTAKLQQEAKNLSARSSGFFKNYYQPIDRVMFATMMQLYAEKVDQSLQSPYFKSEAAKYNYNYKAWSDAVFAKCVFAEEGKLNKALQKFNAKKGKKLLSDPAYKLYAEVSTLYNSQLKANVTPINEKINILIRDYMKAQMLMQKDKDFYPDANLTLRVAYGNVKGYNARDAVYYNYSTTDAGLEQKYIPGDEEFDMPKKLVTLLHENNFGRYANEDGALPIAFIATNHTTGGNSGSPVINGNGELIGINYDRVWEGTMSDIMFDMDRCRNISLDIRYTLFIIEKFAGASNIISELNIVE